MTKEESSGEEAPQENAAGGTPNKDANADIYENRGTKKIIRLITVMAYMFSVSFVAILLSGYYLFLWKPPNPRLIRRNYLRTDPQIQFLLSDPPISPSRSGEDLDEIAAQDLFKEIIADHANFSNSPPMIVGRLAGDVFTANNTIDTQEYEIFKSRKQFYKPLIILRNNLMNILRGRVSHTSETKDPHVAGSIVDAPRSLENKAELPGRIVSASETNKSSMNDNNTSLKLNSSTISRDEANESRFTSQANATKHGSVRRINQPESSSIRSANIRGENYQGNWENIEISGRNESERSTSDIERNISGDYAPIKVLQSTSTNLSDKRSINSNRTPVKTKKLYVYDRIATQVTIMKDDKNRVSERDLSRDTDTSPRNKKIDNSIRSSEYKDRFESPQPLKASAAKLAKVPMNAGETQIERMTAKSTTAGSERSQFAMETTTTTQRPRDILTILAKSTSTTKIPSIISSSTAFEDLQADSSPATKTPTESTT